MIDLLLWNRITSGRRNGLQELCPKNVKENCGNDSEATIIDCHGSYIIIVFYCDLYKVKYFFLMYFHNVIYFKLFIVKPNVCFEYF